jgi:MEMO1 family protein
MQRVLKPAVAGMFYPGETEALKGSVQNYLDAVPGDDLVKDPFGLIVPHAGYAYSGPVAAAAYAHLQGSSVKTVVLLGPSHRVHFKAASVAPYDACETPAGSIPVDRALAKKLLAEGAFFTELPEAHSGEHSLEVQLPFLQGVLQQGFSVLPIVAGSMDADSIRAAAEALHRVAAEEGVSLLFVCSTDLSHDYPYQQAQKMDAALADMLSRLDYTAMAAAFACRSSEACGAVPLLIMMQLAALSGRSRVRICDLRNSGDIVGDPRSRIVGYMSALIY